MTRIRQKAFANRIEEYVADSTAFRQRRFDSSLFCVDPHGAAGGGPLMRGLCFGYHIGLVMFLLGRSFEGLRDKTRPRAFAVAVAGAMQDFAEPFADGDLNCFPYPHFLLHNLEQPTLAAVLAQFETNSRVLHETLAERSDFLLRHQGPRELDCGLSMRMEEGVTEDFYGICCYISRREEQNPHGTDSTYIAKASFFLDTRLRDVYIITLQGQRIHRGDRQRSQGYARLGARLGMDPRAYLLHELCALAAEEGYQRLRVIRPAGHPMHLEGHEGFMARYEPVVRQAGIAGESRCYLETLL